MSRKLTTEILREEAKQYGFELLDEHIKNEKLRIMCKRGHIQKHFPYYFKKAKCEECLKIEKVESIRKEIETMGYKLLNIYENIDTVLQTICPNGHERNCQIDSFRLYGCDQCYKDRKLDELIKRIEDNGYEIITYPKDTRGTLKAICGNGHIREAKAYNFINHNCMECQQGRPIKYDYEFCNKMFSDKGFILLEFEYIDCKTMMRYLCVCGEENETTLDILMHVDMQGCNKCKGIRYSGENHYNWKGGISPESSKIRNSGEYIQWRKNVLQRDSYTCQCCNAVGGSLNVHHIENFSSNENKRFDIENGVTLCEKCHSMMIKGSFHHVYGTRNNNREQLQDYIMNYIEYQSKYELI